MKDDKSINDSELHAYLDGQLDEQQRKEIESNLPGDTHAREKLHAYSDMNLALHELYDPVLDEDIPAKLLNVSSRRPSYRNIAASIFFFIFGSLFGWQWQLNLAQTENGPSATDRNLVQPAAFAHAVYAVEVAHPVEISAEQHQHLNRWLSKRLKTSLSAPDLTDSGYRLIGGRLLPSTEDRMAAQYMYENRNGNRVTLYVRRGDWGSHAQPISYREQKGYAMFYWTDDDMGYALTGTLDKHPQQALAQEIYKQMSINSVKI